MRERPLVVVGDSLLDVDLVGTVERLCPDAPVPVVDQVEEVSRPGGAALAAALAARDGRRVTLVTALGRDSAGATLRALLDEHGVEVLDLGLDGATPEKVRVRGEGRALLRLDRGGRGGAGVAGAPGDDVLRALGAAAAVLVSDYGRGLLALPALRQILAATGARAPLVWDPHPRGADPVPGARLATPNRAEAMRFAPGVDGDGLAAHAARARLLAETWQVAAVAVTLGASGAVMAGRDGVPMAVPARAVQAGDPCGAGDRFAATAAARLGDGASLGEAVSAAVATASAFVAAGGVAALQPEREVTGVPARAASGMRAARELVERVRARGGTVVAAGGCFDLLHAGHVEMLHSARRLGDCLVVLLNSDASVRRIKGAGRPLVPEADRAAVLAGLRCVDAVAVFDEDTPGAVLRRLRPHVFAKGGDYALARFPEAEVVQAWGGQAVVLPFLQGRSSSRLMDEAFRRGAR